MCILKHILFGSFYSQFGIFPIDDGKIYNNFGTFSLVFGVFNLILEFLKSKIIYKFIKSHISEMY